MFEYFSTFLIAFFLSTNFLGKAEAVDFPKIHTFSEFKNLDKIQRFELQQEISKQKPASPRQDYTQNSNNSNLSNPEDSLTKSTAYNIKSEKIINSVANNAIINSPVLITYIPTIVLTPTISPTPTVNPTPAVSPAPILLDPTPIPYPSIIIPPYRCKEMACPMIACTTNLKAMPVMNDECRCPCVPPLIY